MLVYALLINSLAFIVIGYDKKQARRGGWRVPEKRMLLLAGIGGAVGVYWGMLHFRHKTRHGFLLNSVRVFIFVNLITFYFLVRAFGGGEMVSRG